jgi:hypothetical protein
MFSTAKRKTSGGLLSDAARRKFIRNQADIFSHINKGRFAARLKIRASYISRQVKTNPTEDSIPLRMSLWLINLHEQNPAAAFEMLELVHRTFLAGIPESQKNKLIEGATVEYLMTNLTEAYCKTLQGYFSGESAEEMIDRAVAVETSANRLKGLAGRIGRGGAYEQIHKILASAPRRKQKQEVTD